MNARESSYLKRRWCAFWKQIGGKGSGAKEYEVLHTAYTQSHRAYHDLEHIAEGLSVLDLARQYIPDADGVELGWWWHDWKYDPRETVLFENERQSANALMEHCANSGVHPRILNVGLKTVDATRHDRPADDLSARFGADIDLAGFAKPYEAFQLAGEKIRFEYQHVEERKFLTKRREILQGFLKRRRIYQTDYFTALCEREAQRNLARACRELKAKIEALPPE